MTPAQNNYYEFNRLTSWNGKRFEYDQCGNPTLYKGEPMTWMRGRLLENYEKGGKKYEFNYDANGERFVKKIGDKSTNYYSLNGRLIREERADGTILYSMEELQEQSRKITEEELREQIKPLPKNGFARFFVKLYRKWLEKWYAFSDRHRKGAALLQKAFFFLVFSVGVTIWQYIVMTFLPYAFARFNNGEWGWPNIPVPLAGGVPYMIFGDAQGLGYFIAFEIAVFTAQCINFPLQRNITYRSHGNPYIQALWYFVGWVLISVFTNALWGICNCFLVYWKVPDAVTGIGKTMITGIVSMVVFFFIFLIIFPDNVKLAKKARKKYDRARLKNAPQDKLSKLEQRAAVFEKRARISEADKAYAKAASQASSSAMRYLVLKPGKDESEEEFAARKEAALQTAGGAIQQKALAAQELEEAKK